MLPLHVKSLLGSQSLKDPTQCHSAGHYVQYNFHTKSSVSAAVGYGERIFKNLSAYGIITSKFSSCISSSFNLTSTGPYFFCFHMSAARASMNDHICGIFEGLRKVSVSYTNLLILRIIFSSNRSTMPTDYCKRFSFGK